MKKQIQKLSIKLNSHSFKINKLNKFKVKNHIKNKIVIIRHLLIKNHSNNNIILKI